MCGTVSSLHQTVEEPHSALQGCLLCLSMMLFVKRRLSPFGFCRGSQLLSARNIQETWYSLSKLWKIPVTQDHKKCETWKHINKLIKVDSGAYVYIIIFIASLFFYRGSDHALYYFLKIASNIHMHNFFSSRNISFRLFHGKDHFQITCCTNFTLWHILPD